jgi:hypothetical protein
VDVVSDSAAPEHGPASDDFCGPTIHVAGRHSVAGCVGEPPRPPNGESGARGHKTNPTAMMM